jgi:hypothetical protein
MHLKTLQAALPAAAMSLLVACGGSSSSSPVETGPLTVSVTDLPVNSTTIARVCVDFNRITVHYAGQADVVLDYDPLPSQVTPATHCTPAVPPWDGTPPVPAVWLDALGGPLTVALAESAQIPVGRITWMRLHFTGESYVLDNWGGEHDLRCPSCEETDNNDGRGFKLVDTFEVDSNGLVLTVDIDLRKSLHKDGSGYVLRPTARVERSETLGAIAGDVDAGLIPEQGGMAFTGADLDTGCAAYIYAGHDITPDDYFEGSPVFATAAVRYNEGTGLYRYAAGGIPGGTDASPLPYTVALSCDSDDPLFDDSETDVSFTAGQNANVVAGQTTSINFPP